MRLKNAAFLSLSLLISACGADESKPVGQTAPPLVEGVQTAKASKSSLEDFYEATGTVKAKTSTNVSSNIMGRIVSFSVNEGDSVSKGQIIAEIDNREMQAQLQRAQAGLQEAQAALTEIEKSVEGAEAAVRSAEASKRLADQTLSRIRSLHERKAASSQELDEAEARARAAASELERANSGVRALGAKQKQVLARIDQAKAEIGGVKVVEGYSKVAAPVSGVLVKKFSEQGAIASPGMPLVSIEDNSSFRLEASVEESKARSVRIGGRVVVRIDSVGASDVAATVAEIVPSADPATRSYTVKIALPAIAGVRSGMFGVAQFPMGQREVLAVPRDAVVERGQMSGVFVIGTDGIARFRIVSAGKSSEGLVEILSGVSDGEEVAVSGLANLNDGSKVR
jgi:multidrug efflux pump subunit AcrA (membrane-fusion protein)